MISDEETGLEVETGVWTGEMKSCGVPNKNSWTQIARKGKTGPGTNSMETREGGVSVITLCNSLSPVVSSSGA